MVCETELELTIMALEDTRDALSESESRVLRLQSDFDLLEERVSILSSELEDSQNELQRVKLELTNKQGDSRSYFESTRHYGQLLADLQEEHSNLKIRYDALLFSRLSAVSESSSSVPPVVSSVDDPYDDMPF